MKWGCLSQVCFLLMNPPLFWLLVRGMESLVQVLTTLPRMELESSLPTCNYTENVEQTLQRETTKGNRKKSFLKRACWLYQNGLHSCVYLTMELDPGDWSGSPRPDEQRLPQLLELKTKQTNNSNNKNRKKKKGMALEKKGPPETVLTTEIIQQTHP